jgi:hypothetical protein
VKGIPGGYRLGAGIRVLSGQAAGRQLYCLNHGRDAFFCEGHGEANLKRFVGLKVGDEVHIDNRAFLAFCYYYRHHISESPLYDFLRVDGRPIFPQHPVPLQSPLMGVPYSGQYKGKLLWVHHTHDASLWPSNALSYKEAVERVQGPQGAAERFRLRWTENAEHIPPRMLPPNPGRMPTTWLVNFHEVIEQSLYDLCDWVEKGIPPAHTNFTFAHGKVSLPASARERGGIQPVVKVSANGGIKAEIRKGDSVNLRLEAEVPPGAGSVILVEWDFDGSGSYPVRHRLEDRQARVEMSTSHTYDNTGVYFVTARVTSHRQGDPDATSCRVENVAAARVIVR